MSESFIRKGKKSRNELRLPVLHYIAADQWIDELGVKAFRAWLKLHSWVDRRDENRKYDRVPYTLENTAEKLGIKSIATLYNTILKPLWEYELIDIVEYTDSKRKSQAPKNIIIYESPRNEYKSAVEPLKKTRDWKKDYGSASQIHGRKGGRPKKEEQQKDKPAVARKSPYPLKNKRVVLYPLKINRVHPLIFKRVTLLKIKPNNVFNNLLTLSNNPSNVSNNRQQQTEEKEVVVISSDNSILICEKWEELFNESLSVKKISDIANLAIEGMKMKQIGIHNPNEKEVVDRILHVLDMIHKHSMIKTNAWNTISTALEDGYTWTSKKPTMPRKKQKQSNELVPSSLAKQQLQQAQQEVAASVDNTAHNEEWEAINNQLVQWQQQKKSKASQ